jgi:hypothetical protein
MLGRLAHLDPADERALYSMEVHHPVRYFHTAVILRKTIGVALRKSKAHPTEIPDPILLLRRMWCIAVRLQHVADDVEFTMLDCDLCQRDTPGRLECSLCGTLYHPTCICESFARLSERVRALPEARLSWADLPALFKAAAALCIFCKHRFKDLRAVVARSLQIAFAATRKQGYRRRYEDTCWFQVVANKTLRGFRRIWVAIFFESPASVFHDPCPISAQQCITSSSRGTS